MSNAIGYAQTGFVLDTVEGTFTPAVSAHFNNDVTAETLNLQITKEDLRNVGRNGITQRVNGQTIATIPNMTVPSFGKQDASLLMAAGFTSAAANTYILYAPASTGANASRTSTKTLSVTQYDGKRKYELSAAKPTNMSLGVFDGKKIGWTVGLQGNGSISATTSMLQQYPITTAAPAVLVNAPVTISGTSIPYSDINIDLGLTYENGAGDASTASGHRLIGEITQYDPKVTLTVWEEDSVIALLNSYVNNTAPAISCAYGSTAGSIYTWTFTGMIDNVTPGLDGKIRNDQYVISPIAKTDGELIRLVIS